MSDKSKSLLLSLFLVTVLVSLYAFSDFFDDDDICLECENSMQKTMRRDFSKLDSLRNNYFQTINLLKS